jgi:chromate reductase
MPDPDALDVVALSGSLRAGSYNTALLRAALALAPDGVHVELHTIRGIPIYDGDEEARSGVPPVVQALKDRIARADALLIASPEYNNSLPGPLKNAIDWMSRPPKDIARVFGGRPVGLIGATPGRGGTRLAQTAWLPVFRTLGMRAYAEHSLYVGSAAEVFDGNGALRDDTVKELLTKFLVGFAGFVGQQRP